MTVVVVEVVVLSAVDDVVVVVVVDGDVDVLADFVVKFHVVVSLIPAKTLLEVSVNASAAI